MPVPDRVPSSPDLPSRVDVAIVGGGIVGVSAAWHLARRGMAVALMEKGEIAGEQSSRNWGYCRQQGRDPAEIPLAMESLEIWRTLDADIGVDTGFRQTGILYASDDEATIAGWRAWLEHAKLYQLESRLVSGRDLQNLVADAPTGWKAGLWTPSDGRAEPTRAAPAIARAAQAAGAHVITQCAVRGLDVKAGRVSGVVTEREPVAADAVLLAGGAWTRTLCKRHGVLLKSLNVKASAMRTGEVPDIFSGGLSTPRYSVRRRADGGYTIAWSGATTYEIVPDGIRWLREFWPAYRMESHRMKVRLGRRFFSELFARHDWSLDATSPFEVVRALDPSPDRAVLQSALEELRRDFPVLGEVAIVEQWAGMIDSTPDAVPVISGVDDRPGLFLATGFSGHGFALGPGAGRLAADLIAGKPPVVDPAPYRHSRMTDGTRLRPWAA